MVIDFVSLWVDVYSNFINDIWKEINAGLTKTLIAKKKLAGE